MAATPYLPPPPNGQVLSLVSALSQTENHDLHVQAIQARDLALSSSPESYGNLCLQLAYLMIGCDVPETLVQRILPSELEVWRQTDPSAIARLQGNMAMWVPFGQMAGLILKNALLRPPTRQGSHSTLSLENEVAKGVKEVLIYGLSLAHKELRNVISSVIADCSVSPNGVQPYLCIKNWPELMSALTFHLNPANSPTDNAILGSLSTVQKMMEDDPDEIPTPDIDVLIPLLLQLFESPNETKIVGSLQSLVACLAYGLVPSALVLHFSKYLEGLSRLATNSSVQVRKWVCRSINTLLEHHAQYIQPQWVSICQFMLQSTIQQQSATSNPDDQIDVVTEACEFWFIFASLDEMLLTTPMLETVQGLLPQLIPVLLNNMVYSEEQKIDLQAQNELDMEVQANASESMKPVFHKSKNKHENKDGTTDNVSGGDDDDDDDDDFDDDDNEWNLRKYAGASLDCLANLYGPEPILPNLLPSLQNGLSSTDPWVQEASILALGAVADGCREAMYAHMNQLFSYLMNLLATPESVQYLPQVKCICAWTASRYAEWVINEVQTGSNGHLLAQMTEVLLQRLQDKNRKVQVACGSALGELMEAAGDLMAPYLQEIYPALVSAMAKYQGRSLVIIFDTIGIMADYCGPEIGEDNLPSMYVPHLLQFWNNASRQDPTNRILLPLMETLASICVTCGMNYQPYALETFETSMAVIEQVQMMLATTENPAYEEADPIMCATDLLDSLCEGLGSNFSSLVLSSTRYSQNFTNVVHALCTHHSIGVRMSALALLGDLARNAPGMIESSLPQHLQDALSNLESNIDESESNLYVNAVWAIGEICVKCGGNSSPLEPYAPALMQKLIALLMGNGTERVSAIPGLAENSAACVGRLANVNAVFVAPDLPRFLLGWTDGLSKISDVTEKRDAFRGLCSALYANPQAIHQVQASTPPDVITSIIFAITSWHIPPDFPDDINDFLNGDYQFVPFPPSEADLGNRLAQLIQNMKSSIGVDSWKIVESRLPVNVLRLFREVYGL